MFNTKRINIIPATPNDIEAISDILRIPEYALFITLPPYGQHLKEINDSNTELCILIEKETNEMIGFYFAILSPDDLTYELTRIAITKQRQGFATEVFEAMFDYVFNTLKYNRFWLDVYTDNDKGIALYEKLGLHLDAVLRQNKRKERGLMDQAVYSLLKEEYEKR